MKILMIIPCFNEAQRLNILKYKEHATDNLQFLFADDGSTDETANMISKASKEESEYFHHYIAPANKGKASVIRDAYLENSDWIENEGFEMVGYWDADLATPLFEVATMLKFLNFQDNSNYQAIWASRIQRLGSKINRSPIRHHLGRAFANVTSYFLKVECYDSQCGAKLFTLSAWKEAFRDPFVTHWVFDVEILLRLKGKFQVLEYPLQLWTDVPGSKVKIFKDIFRVLKDIWFLRRKYVV